MRKHIASVIFVENCNCTVRMYLVSVLLESHIGFTALPEYFKAGRICGRIETNIKKTYCVFIYNWKKDTNST